MYKFTPDNIEKLLPKQVFVFGSNILGNHVGGAARKALDDFGAIWGQGEGLQGNSYAFPTLNEYMHQYSIHQLDNFRQNLYTCCIENKNKQFLLTKIGCGIAGYDEDLIKSIFKYYPDNLILPKDWIG